MKKLMAAVAAFVGAVAFGEAEFADNCYATLKFDDKGAAYSFVEHRTGRELLGERQPFVMVELKDGKTLFPVKCEKRTSFVSTTTAIRFRTKKNTLCFTFPDGAGEAEFVFTPFNAGWEIKLERLTVKDVEYIEWGRFKPACNKYIGESASMYSDDKSGVCLRSFDLPLMMYVNGDYRKGNTLRVGSESKHGGNFIGLRSGLVAGAREDLIPMLRMMTSYSGVVHSLAGGAWACDAEINRSSYAFATPTTDSVEEWIDFALRSGCTTLLIHAWMETWGHNQPKTSLYPNGVDDMVSICDQIHAAGLHCGIHTLTGLMGAEDSQWSKHDKWVSPVADSRLKSVKTYTLARPLKPGDTELFVNEQPIKKHHCVFTYSGWGNTFRIGGELVQYAELSREKPYRFGKLKRGAFNTIKNEGELPAGTKVEFLQSRYGGFYPDCDTTLADELGQCYADTFEACKMDMFYFDGSEGCGDLYDVAGVRKAIFSKFDWKNRPIVTEASCGGAHNWWIRSRTGTFDYPYWAAKRLHDYHITTRGMKARNCDLLEPQMGWWEPRRADSWHRAIFTDEMEYFAAKNAGIDAAMSCEKEKIVDAPLAFWPEKMMTVLGWYEYFRLARAWAPGVKEKLAKLGEETRLRQEKDGVWRIQDVVYDTHRVSTADYAEWKVKAQREGEALVRVEALYDADETQKDENESVLCAKDLANYKQETAKDIDFKVRAGKDAMHGDYLALRADSKRGSAVGAWARIRREIPYPYGLKLKHAKDGDAYGLWVMGDGSGAILNLQFENASEYTKCYADHCVKLDFKGWRYVKFLLRERDADEFTKWVWPYSGDYEIYRYLFYPSRCSAVTLYVNGIPAKGRLQIAVSDVKPMPQVKRALERPVITVNGEKYALPFAKLEAGDFAELADGEWVRYSEMGDPQEWAPAAKLPRFQIGENAIRFDSANHGRGEITFGLLGEKRDALKATLTAAERAQLGYEAAYPDFYAPKKGFKSLKPIAVRPGDEARLQLFMVGKVKNPVIELNGKKYALPIELKEGQRFACRDGYHWTIKGEKLALVSEGTFAAPLPVLNRTTAVGFTSDNADDEVRVSFVKRYPKPGEFLHKPTATTMVQFWFDTEDYTYDPSTDSWRDIANVLKEEGVRGHFNLAGQLAQFVMDNKRYDIIEAMKYHLIGSQSFYHSWHPNITEMGDYEDYDHAYHLSLAEEARVDGALKAVFGHKKLWFSVWPGPGSSYVACDAAYDLGMPFMGGIGAIRSGRPFQSGQCWYQNQRHICYNAPMSLEDLMPAAIGRSGTVQIEEKLNEAAKLKLVAFSMHPHMINRVRSWDVDSLCYGNNVEFGKWFTPEVRTKEEVDVFLANLRYFIRRIKEDPRFEFVDCEQLAAEQKPRAPISMKDIPAIRAALIEKFGPIDKPASWCVADCFQAVVKLLRGEKRHLPGNVYGFLYAPKGVKEKTVVSAAELRAAAAKMTFKRHLPYEIEVGDKTIGPADFLFAALEVLETGKETVEIAPREQLGDIASEIPNLAAFSHGRWIFTADFKDEWLPNRIRWQYWTLRYE